MANLVVNAFFNAEAQNTTEENTDTIIDVLVGGSDSDLATLVRDLVSNFGHYGDLYRTHIEPGLPRGEGRNGVYDSLQTSGLL